MKKPLILGHRGFSGPYPENTPIGTRRPFTLERYKKIPADTDYITIWFGTKKVEVAASQVIRSSVSPKGESL